MKLTKRQSKILLDLDYEEEAIIRRHRIECDIIEGKLKKIIKRRNELAIKFTKQFKLDDDKKWNFHRLSSGEIEVREVIK